MSRESAARISALKDQDYAEYLRLARNTKDKRLRTLLDKTDSIISDLGLKVCSLTSGSIGESQGLGAVISNLGHKVYP